MSVNWKLVVSLAATDARRYGRRVGLEGQISYRFSPETLSALAPPLKFCRSYCYKHRFLQSKNRDSKSSTLLVAAGSTNLSALAVLVLGLSEQPSQPVARSPITSSSESSVLPVLGSSELGALCRQTTWVSTTDPCSMDFD